jgi:hypothetical protein
MVESFLAYLRSEAVICPKFLKIFAGLQPARHALYSCLAGAGKGQRICMAAATIIHFGTDLRHRTEVFKTAGYVVNNCSSFDQLHSALIAIPPADAVAFDESRGKLCARAVSLTRATSSLPLVLFRSLTPRLDASEFDLVVPVLTPPQVWIAEVVRVVEESRLLDTQYEALRQESALLRQQSALLRMESAAARERSRLERARSAAEAQRNARK